MFLAVPPFLWGGISDAFGDHAQRVRVSADAITSCGFKANSRRQREIEYFRQKTRPIAAESNGKLGENCGKSRLSDG